MIEKLPSTHFVFRFCWKRGSQLFAKILLDQQSRKSSLFMPPLFFAKLINDKEKEERYNNWINYLIPFAGTIALHCRRQGYLIKAVAAFYVRWTNSSSIICTSDLSSIYQEREKWKKWTIKNGVTTIRWRYLLLACILAYLSLFNIESVPKISTWNWMQYYVKSPFHLRVFKKMMFVRIWESV